MKLSKKILLVSIIVIISGIFFRYFKLLSFPCFAFDAEPLDAFISKLMLNKQISLFNVCDYNKGSIPFWFISFFYYLFGASFKVIRYYSFFIGILTAIIIFIYIKKTYDINSAFAATSLYIINPWSVFISRQSMVYNIAPLFFLLGWIFFKLSEKNKYYIIISSIFFGVLCHIPQYLIIIPIISSIILCSKTKFKFFKITLFIVFFIIIYSPLIIYNYSNNYPTYKFFYEGIFNGQYSDINYNNSNFILSKLSNFRNSLSIISGFSYNGMRSAHINYSFSFIIIFYLIYFIYNSKRKLYSPDVLIIILPFIFYLLISSNLKPRRLIYIIPFISIFFSLNIKDKKKLSFFIFLSLYWLILTFNAFYNTYCSTNDINKCSWNYMKKILNNISDNSILITENNRIDYACNFELFNKNIKIILVPKGKADITSTYFPEKNVFLLLSYRLEKPFIKIDRFYPPKTSGLNDLTLYKLSKKQNYISQLDPNKKFMYFRKCFNKYFFSSNEKFAFNIDNKNIELLFFEKGNRKFLKLKDIEVKTNELTWKKLSLKNITQKGSDIIIKDVINKIKVIIKIILIDNGIKISYNLKNISNKNKRIAFRYSVNSLYFNGNSRKYQLYSPGIESIIPKKKLFLEHGWNYTNSRLNGFNFNEFINRYPKKIKINDFPNKLCFYTNAHKIQIEFLDNEDKFLKPFISYGKIMAGKFNAIIGYDIKLKENKNIKIDSFYTIN